MTNKGLCKVKKQNKIELLGYLFWENRPKIAISTGTAILEYSTVEPTSPYGHLTSKVTSPLRSPLLSPKLYSTALAKNRRIAPCNTVTSPLGSLIPSTVGNRISEVPLYHHVYYVCIPPPPPSPPSPLVTITSRTSTIKNLG